MSDSSEDRVLHRPTFIRQWREFRGLTQEELADRLGMTASFLSMLERGQRGYTQETIESIADSLATDVASLLTKNPRQPHAKPPRRLTFLREWRKYRGYTLEEAAELAGMTAGNLSAMERGAQGYTQDGLEAVANAYDCHPAHLLMAGPCSKILKIIKIISESDS